MVTGQVKCHLKKITNMLLPVAGKGYFQREQLYANSKTTTAKECLCSINIQVEIVDTISVLQVQILGLFCACPVCLGK